MATLNKLAIRGIRSFDDKQISVIEFFSPVTVIVGHNGSGKTTIIECLKYATTGDQPPNTRGGAFVHDPKMANEKEVKAQVKLRFNTGSGKRMLAVRNLSVTVKKGGALTMKTLESILANANDGEKSGKRGVISTKCAEMDAEIPHLLGVSKAVLENVIFCHQEDSYWPLAEPSALKKKFDDIFEATKYTKALDAIKSLRKDRVAELKAEQERLESLSREKAHSDKLVKRISDLNSTITTKELEYEEVKREYDELVQANKRFYEQGTKFREMYLKLESLQEKKSRYEEDLASARENLQVVAGTDEEIVQRLSNFDKHIAERKEKRRSEAGHLQDLEDELVGVRKSHMESVNEHGSLKAEETAQSRRIEERETLIRSIGAKHHLKGYDHSPLEREKVLEFLSRLGDLQRSQNAETERLQTESRARMDEYNVTARKLNSELEALKQQKSSMKSQIATLRSKITSAESSLDQTSSLNTDIRTLRGDIEEKKRRLDRARQEIKDANFDERISEKSSKARALEDRREDLNAEIRTLSLQADSRARLDLKRAEMKSKKNEIQNILDVNNQKFRKLVGKDAKAETMERELERVSTEKEREHENLDAAHTEATKSLQQVETTLTNMKAQLKLKKEEVQALEKKIKQGIKEELYGSNSTVEAACQVANEEVNQRGRDSGAIIGASQIYETLLRTGKTKKTCTACNRHLNTEEMVVFENYASLQEQMKRTSPERIKQEQEELKEWQMELTDVQKLLPVEAARNKLVAREIPELEQSIKEKQKEIPLLTDAANNALAKLNDVKRELKDLASMKNHSANVSKATKDIERISQEVKNLETDLEATGSSRTADDVQNQLNEVTANLRSNERERQTLQTEKEMAHNALRTHEKDFGDMQLREVNLQSQVKDRAMLERQAEDMKAEVATASQNFKEIDSKIEAAQAPIKKLDEEYQQADAELTGRISEAQRTSQELNMSVDRLDGVNKLVDRYIREKRSRQLKECEHRITEHESSISELAKDIESTRDTVAIIDKEVNESNASMTNLRENIRVRKLAKEIEVTQAEIDAMDMEEAAKARRQFDVKYNLEKQRETEMQSQYAHIGGELSSLKDQVQTLEYDLAEFENVNKRYKDQLIKVKMSDMANNDLEKYAKALDNAIMKYHSLKMEEVNDTMKHLWNKTYQGTDIDGIRIRSDVEGGASKRSYNYRVVMAKDQVEMDMRGRCSAGQKMLASIIIRLALADSFGQNCGILALDEPTNALDTENIDALAASLVDIINERKNHANFQLIIITHDENFLRKLGQGDVMDYYWRVSRDSRQKSIIERQRFG
ncbi:AAA domain-containing protein [Thelephora terrestris]|uniref:DNA repair protein RAD50 n=1 Tax=Thelephora terrestris TaxID=56493 RepID=A0A9P6HC66_9AGAM|nr:AAA domain-containing protein [Thelephora terrestris]